MSEDEIMPDSLYFSTTAYSTRSIHEQFDFLSKIRSSIVNTTVSPIVANRYQGDFHGLLTELGIHKDLHTVTTILNGYGSSLEYDGNKTTIDIIAEKDAKIFLEN